MSQPAAQYDYIIAGGGGAGLSLLYRLSQSERLRHRRILLLDREPEKVANDRTWCFWEREAGLFESIVHHRWTDLWVYQGRDFARCLSIAPYTYKMIRSADFYRYVREALPRLTGLESYAAGVRRIRNSGPGVQVDTDTGRSFTADWCFSSIPHEQPDRSRVNYLDQHFRGWFIRTDQAAFSPDEAVFMDFRTPQQGEARFFYLLPTSAHTALVELAIFSNNHLSKAAYDDLIGSYLREQWPRLGAYQIEEAETGVIPMTDHPFRPQDGRIVYLGTAGGDTRASTGYTFWNIQQRLDRLVPRLEQGATPYLRPTWSQRRHRLYDSVLLRVLQHNYADADRIFASLFANNPPQRVLAFLNGQSSMRQELALLASVPTAPFARALWEEVATGALRRLP